MNACEKLTYENLEIFVVDNDPIKPLDQSIPDQFRNVVIIPCPKNPGFAGANNLAIQQAKGDFLCFLNNDTFPSENLIEELLKSFEADETIGGVSPMILYHDQPNVIQYAGYTSVNPYTGRNQTIGQGQTIQPEYEVPRSTAYLHGAAMMIKKEIVEKTGGMPEEYFLYYEELDWSEQMKKLGFKLLYQPNGRIHHRVSASVGKDSLLKTYYYHRNRILFQRRNGSGISQAIFLLYTTLIIIPRYSLTFLFSGRMGHFRAFWRAILWHFKKS